MLRKSKQIINYLSCERFKEEKIFYFLENLGYKNDFFKNYNELDSFSNQINNSTNARNFSNKVI